MPIEMRPVEMRPVEMRRDDRPDDRPGAVSLLAGPGTGVRTGGEGAAALRDLVAARLVDHEAIGDPGRLAGEAAALNGLCGLVAGPVYRLGPFHYGFLARGGDLGGRLAGLAGPARTAALAAALEGALGPEAVWLGPADLAPEAGTIEAGTFGAGAIPAAPLPEAALLVLRAGDAATGAAVAAAGPDLRAAIDARFAAEAARRAGDLATAPGLEAATRAATAAATAAVDRRIAALETAFETLIGSGLAASAAAEARAAAARTAEAHAFEAQIGLALAEFLARLERRAEGAVAS